MNELYSKVKDLIDKSQIKAVTDLDSLDSSKISYHSKICQERKVAKITGKEELVRAALLTRLVNEFGYKVKRYSN